jgi:hypothetical protein
MEEKMFSREEVSRMVSARVNQEREKLTRDFENTLRKRMTSIQRTLLELCVTEQNEADGTQDSYNPASWQN